MCGIVGFVGEEKNKDVIIKKMADRIIHRGPDDEGYYTDDKIALGHRRLSIIDLSSGNQPMYSENFVIIFNGEIYNYKDLREELKDKYEFKTNSDTEVLLHGYKEWGKELPKKLRGMFAFMIWDKEQKRLFGARDFFGIKPLYYYKNGNTFMFGSEIKSFLEHPGFDKQLNKKLIGTYLSFDFTPANETMFLNVKTLEPGQFLIWEDNNLVIDKYFDINFEEKDEEFDKVVDEISDIMKNSIEYHQISDVEVGAFLSSGVDSSYIVSVAKPNKTYTVGYNDDKYSEIKYAEELAQKLGIENISKKITKQEYMDSVSRVLYHMDEPLGDPSIFSLYYLSKMAHKDVKVVMSGEGADEFFGGYNTYRQEAENSAYNKIPFAIRHILALIFKNLPEVKGRNFIVRRGTRLEDEYVGVNKLFSDRERKKVLKDKNTIKNSDITKNIYEKFKDKSNVQKMQAVDIKNWLVKNILLKGDKMAMANSVEGRTPFVDKEVFKVASSLSTKYKLSKEDTKIAFREAAKKEIPTEAYKKKKLGFPVPLREWMREDDVYSEIKQTIEKDFVGELFNQRYVLKLLEQHKNGKKDNYKKVWAVYCFVKWYEIFFRNEDKKFLENINKKEEILV